MLVSEMIMCISAYSFRGCSRPWFGSYTGRESSFSSLSTRKTFSLVKDRTKSSGSTCCFFVALVNKKHRYFPGTCLLRNRRRQGCYTSYSSSFLPRKFYIFYILLKSAAIAFLKLMSALIATCTICKYKIAIC